MLHWTRPVAASKRAQQRIFNRLAADFINQIQHRRDRAAASLRDAPSGEALGDGIEIIDLPVRIGADHGIADRSEGHLRALLLREHRLLGALALSYIGDSALVSEDSPCSIPQDAGVLEHDELFAV